MNNCSFLPYYTLKLMKFPPNLFIKIIECCVTTFNRRLNNQTKKLKLQIKEKNHKKHEKQILKRLHYETIRFFIINYNGVERCI